MNAGWTAQGSAGMRQAMSKAGYTKAQTETALQKMTYDTVFSSEKGISMWSMERQIAKETEDTEGRYLQNIKQKCKI